MAPRLPLEQSVAQIRTSSPHGDRRPKLFIGIDTGAAAKTALANVAGQLQATGIDARFDDASKYHMTLAFLGWCDSSLLDPVMAAMQVCASESAPFVITIDKLGAFPNERRPRVIYAGTRKAPAEFAALATLVRKKVRDVGFTFKDDAVAHITLARIKNATRSLPLVEFEPIEFRVDELTLFESVPDKQTTRYVRIMPAALGV